ncbi:MAG: UbiA prenyltransferase family protein [Acidobacteria bacterium]|nr:UbiA prenyltransferase family protein [Acidobacteriota bacterium]
MTKGRDKSKLASYIDFARPFTLLAPGIGFFAWGFVGLGALKIANNSIALTFDRFWPLILGGFAAAILNIASNGINQIFDLEVDKINKPKRPLPSGSITLKEAWVITIVSYIITFTAAWFIAPPEGGHQTFIVVLIAAFFTYIYSGPPCRTKRFGVLANVTISVPRGALLVIAGWSAAQTVLAIEPWWIALIFGVYIIGAASTKDFSDMKGDEAGGCITLAVKYGIEKSTRIIAPFLVVPFLFFPIGALTGYLTGNKILLIIYGLLLAVYGIFIARLMIKEPDKLATETNHISWKHMYLQMVVAQLGAIAVYWL